MSRKGVFIALLVALGMAAAAWFLLGPKSATTGATTNTPAAAKPFFSFAPSQVTAIEIVHPNGQVERVERDDDVWRLALRRGAGAPDSWTVASAQMRSLLDVLTKLAPAASASDARFTSTPLTLKIHVENGDVNTLAFDTTSIGGRQLVRANDQAPAYIDQPLYGALTQPGPRGWRETRLFDSIGAETARIEIESDQHTLSLARVRGVWRLREPVRAPADHATVDQLLNRIAALNVARWIDTDIERESPPTGAGLKRIAIERDRTSFNSDGPEVTAVRREVFFAGAANLGGAERLVFVGDARTPGAIAAASVQSITLDPTASISRIATDVAPSQVGAIRITLIESGDRVHLLERTIDGWAISADSAPAQPLAVTHVSDALTLFTSRIASAVTLSLPESAAPIAHVELRGFDDGPLESVILFAIENGVVLQTGDVFRTYDGVQTPILLTGQFELDAAVAPAIDEPIK